ncbi:hypothetical protein, partial [Escherichia coli]|uniref:hypothetical protein n=1 Tax=Escherichia coli TaxID=562 RepID=UPI003F75AE6B
YGHGACVEQDDKGWDARKRAYCLKIQPATGSFARNLIYSTKPLAIVISTPVKGSVPARLANNVLTNSIFIIQL